jgi:hypothetical protein
MSGSGRVSASTGCITRLLGGPGGPDGGAAFLLDLALFRHGKQVLKTLLPELAEASIRKEERGSFLTQAEQYLESILDIRCRC